MVARPARTDERLQGIGMREPQPIFDRREVGAASLAELNERDRALRREADRLVARGGLRELLAEYGRPHLSGSYSLHLMTWRDLDIYLAMEVVDRGRFLDLGARLGEAVAARRLSFTDHLNFPATEPVRGLYWGVQTDFLDAGGWKLDVWGVSTIECADRLAHCQAIAARLGDRERHAILRIKQHVCRHPDYRATITSQHIYDAVLDAGVASVDEFWRHLGSDAAPR